MYEDWSTTFLDTGQDALGFSERVGEDNTRQASCLIGCPPAVEFGEHFLLGRSLIGRRAVLASVMKVWQRTGSKGSHVGSDFSL